MHERLRVRRGLYAELARARWGRRILRRQIAQLSVPGGQGPDDGSAGVREPRQPTPPSGSGRRGLRAAR